jgi:signal transduction histidine kinase
LINKALYRLNKWLYLTPVLLVLSIAVVAQSPVMDSLGKALDKARDPRVRVDILNALAYEFYDFNDSLAMAYSKRALQEARKAGYRRGEKRAHTMIGTGYLTFAQFDQAFYHLRLSDQVDVPDAIDQTAYNLSVMASTHRTLANYDSARHYYLRALQLGEQKLSPDVLGTVYKNLGYLEVILWNNASAHAYLLKAERLAIEANDTYLQAEVYGHLGVLLEQLLEFQQAEHYFNKLCELASKQVLYFHLIKCALRTAELQYQKGFFAEALSTSLNALQLIEKYEYQPQVAELYHMMGDIYNELAQYDLALRYYFLGLKITEKFGLRLQTAQLYAQIAWVNKQQSDFDLALDYINRSLDLRMEIGDRHGISNAYNYRGLIYYQTKKYAEAVNDLKASRKIREEIGHIEGVASAVFNLSLVYEDLGEYDNSYALLLEVVELEKSVVNPISLGITYNQLANILTQQKRFDEARKYLELAQQKADESHSILLHLGNSKFYAQWHEATGNYRQAYAYQVKFQHLNDSIYNRSISTKLAEMEALYRVEQKEQQIKLLNQQNELQENKLQLQQSRIRSQGIIIASSLIGLALLAVLAFHIHLYNRRIRRANKEILEQKEEIQTQAEELVDANEVLMRLNREVTEKNEEIQAQSEELMEANQTIYEINKRLEEKVNERTNRLKEAYKELDTFFYRASHDFRRPLTTFMGLAEVARITIKDTGALELFEKVDETAHTLDRMLVKLQSISDVGAQQLVYKEVFISELINDILNEFREEIQTRNIKVTSKISLHDPFYSYPAMVKIALGNLIENAVQFHVPENPTISLTVEQAGDQVLLRIADNGQGIESELQDKIFEMYFRGSDRSKGNGLGLYIAKKAVEKLGGTITVSSTVYLGSTFTVTLPMGNSSGM